LLLTQKRSYLTEAAPRSIRGLCVCIFSGSVYLGIMLGYFANWGTSLHISNKSASQWIDATIMHIIIAGLIFIMSFFALESPRWLYSVGKQEQAAINMSKLRQLPAEHPYVRAELIDINDQLEREQEATMGSGFFGPLKELFLIRSNRYRIVLGLMCQLLGRRFFTIHHPNPQIHVTED
jgi:MFS family permease